MSEEKEIHYVTAEGISISRGKYYKKSSSDEMLEGIPADEWQRVHGPEPKADPKEKELYSIKPLEWAPLTDSSFESRLDGGRYLVSKRATESYYWSAEGFGHRTQFFNCIDLNDGKRQAQIHFNSKLKLCLNREL